jgi:Flp pilus assembly pilin Flp
LLYQSIFSYKEILLMYKILKTALTLGVLRTQAVLADERGDFAQVALFLALVVIVAIGALTGLGTTITDTLTQVSKAI